MALKSMREINREQIEIRGIRRKTAGIKKRGAITILTDTLFYLAIIILLLSLLTSVADDGKPNLIFGHSYYTVMSHSMRDEMPKGSLILVRQTENLKVGDSITYTRENGATVTHKIIEIIENYRHSGYRGFRTMGVNNALPDEDIVLENNVAGKVILVIPAAGDAIAFMRTHILIASAILGLCIIYYSWVRGLIKKTRQNKTAVSGMNPYPRLRYMN